ncbi:glucan 1,3-beta-glucosidase [Dichotomopilus funicola]|uniref:Glucan 1,3-beta-glucosidase n=1 Tax=Dichotomopilus funicola TaxID=1934379 RepID=A0AAN6UYT6_9PEZI|nr:glucan 1,3-beta-glucosidase [Dichotomopilus funicola]
MRLQFLAAVLAACVTAQQQLWSSPEQTSPQKRDSCDGPSAGSPKTWWRSEISHNGTTPHAADTTYEYYRDVVKYGADPTGQEDSSEAFNRAINAWNRTGNTVTTMPAYVYIPPGEYLINGSIQMLVNTYLVGDAVDLPKLVAHHTMWEDPVILGYDAYQGEGGSTKNFYMAVRNLHINTTTVPLGARARAIEWSVSQGCSLTNVHVTMAHGAAHVGVSMDHGGSGTIISDCSFTGGETGVELYGQQYMLKNLRFDKVILGISVIKSHVTTVQNCTFTDCHHAIYADEPHSSGTMSVVDCIVRRGYEAIWTDVSGNGEGSLILEGFEVGGTGTLPVKSSEGKKLLRNSVPAGQVWVMGNTNPDGYQSNKTYSISRPAELLVDGKYFTAPAPQYETYDRSQIVSITEDPDHPVYGDNSHDDGPSINAILAKHANCKIVFFPQGIYRTNTTIHVPPGSRITGEVLSIISGAGAHFSNASNPQPVLRLGNPDDRGVAHLSDLLVTVASPLPGAVLLQINMAGPKPGDVGVWNTVLRVGGAVDSSVSTQCGNPDPSFCLAAFALLHMTESSSAYVENVWGWVADHSLDAPDSDPPQNIAVGRGALVESKGPSWLVGTSFEHCVLYQYALHGAENLYIGQHQSESAYWQGPGTPVKAPAPWKPNAALGDPGFENCAKDDDACRRSWGLYVKGVKDVVVHGSAMWSFFHGMNDNLFGDPECTSTGGICQTNMAYIEDAKSMWWFSASSKAAENLVLNVGGGPESTKNVNVSSQKDYPGAWGAVMVDDNEGDDSGGIRLTPGLGLAVAVLAMTLSLFA